MSSINRDNFEERLRRLLDRVPSPVNRATLERYLDELQVQGRKPGTVWNSASCLVDTAIHLESKPFEETTKADIAAFFKDLRTGGRDRTFGNRKTRKRVQLSNGTMAQRMILARAFYAWHRGCPPRQYPPEVNWLKPPRVNETIAAHQLPTDDDLLKMLQAVAATVPQGAGWHAWEGRALLAALAWTGARAGELVSLNFEGVEPFDWGLRLVPPPDAEGWKTGRRPLFILNKAAEEYVREWIAHHPRPRPNEPLFLSFAPNRLPRSRDIDADRLTPQGLRLFLLRVGRKAGVARRVNPHAWRHAHATRLARAGLVEGELKPIFGWSSASDMAGRYVHATREDALEKMAEIAGRKRRDHATGIGLTHKTCLRCGAKSLPSDQFCGECKAPLTLQTPTASDRERVKAVLADVLLQVLAAGEDETKLDGPAGLVLDLLERAKTTG